MKKTGHPFDYAWAPFALLALFYFGGLWQRPMFDLEYSFAAWTGMRQLFQVRFGSAAATLLTAGVLYLFMRNRDRVTGGIAACIYLSTGVVFAAGTAADRTAYFTLGMTLFICSLWDVITRRKIFAVAGAAAGGILAGYAVTRMPVPAFRFEYYGWYLMGLFPWLLFLPVLLDGGLKRTADGPGIDFKTPVPRMAVFGIIIGLGALVLREWTAAMPFLALLEAMALQEYAKAQPEMKRFDKLLFHWFKLFAMCGVMLIVGFLLVRTGKINPFPLPSHMLMTVFALLMLLLWLYMARRERRLAGKCCYISLGAAFFLCGMPALLPAGITAKHAPAEMVRRVWPKGHSSLFITTPELADTLWYSIPGKRFTVVPLDKIVVPPGKHTVLLIRAKDTSKLPVPQQRIVMRSSGLAVLEYQMEYKK